MGESLSQAKGRQRNPGLSANDGGKRRRRSSEVQENKTGLSFKGSVNQRKAEVTGGPGSVWARGRGAKPGSAPPPGAAGGRARSLGPAHPGWLALFPLKHLVNQRNSSTRPDWNLERSVPEQAPRLSPGRESILDPDWRHTG